MSTLTTARFKEVLGHFATGVTVVAAATNEGPAGFTCQSFAALSLEPLLVTFAARRAGSSWPKIRQAGTVAISVLSEEQESIARSMATSGGDKFADIAHFALTNGAPGIAGALAHIEGTVVSVSEHGDHDIAVVEVTGLHCEPGRPLLYFRGGFGSFSS
jgi:flavin reductase (DIM6/NTAB) family NADH-FMN oxidoreductase RutF